MLGPAEVVGHVPDLGPGAAGHVLASLHVLRVPTAAAATRIGADCGARDCAASGGHIPAASAADLMSQHASDDAADDRTRNIGTAAAPVVGNLLALDPAAVLRRADDCAYGSHVRLVESLIRPLAILIGGHRHRRWRL